MTFKRGLPGNLGSEIIERVVRDCVDKSEMDVSSVLRACIYKAWKRIHWKSVTGGRCFKPRFFGDKFLSETSARRNFDSQ